jgi:hypothetical protein
MRISKKTASVPPSPEKELRPPKHQNFFQCSSAKAYSRGRDAVNGSHGPELLPMFAKGARGSAQDRSAIPRRATPGPRR